MREVLLRPQSISRLEEDARGLPPPRPGFFSRHGVSSRVPPESFDHRRNAKAEASSANVETGRRPTLLVGAQLIPDENTDEIKRHAFLTCFSRGRRSLTDCPCDIFKQAQRIAGNERTGLRSLCWSATDIFRLKRAGYLALWARWPLHLARSRYVA